MNHLILHGYWRSSASYRVRIALGLKGIAIAHTPHDLRQGDQHSESYKAISPQGLVPALDTPEGVIVQSLAILEWLEECFPQPPLLPGGAADRAVVRSMAALIACDVHPLNNLRVLETLRSDFDASGKQITNWIGRWISDGFAALQQLVDHHGGAFAFGDTPGLADCVLIPQIYSARRFHVDLDAFPLLVGIDQRARDLPAFERAHPDAQPDADG